MNTKNNKPNRTAAAKDKILIKEKEDRWRIPPSLGIPKYVAEEDRFCPTGQIRRFNDEKRLAAKSVAVQERTMKQWTSSTLQLNLSDTPLKTSDLRFKSNNYHGLAAANQNEYSEIHILQKIIVRENLLGELHKLVKSQHDLAVNMGQIVDLVKALRYQTVDIVDDIGAWQDAQPSVRPFLYKDLNYLVKIKCDLDFLDLHEQVVECFCFEFKSNPLAFRGGGNIITGYQNASTVTSKKNLLTGYRESDGGYVDDLEVSHLHACEKIIQREFIRLSVPKENIQLRHPQVTGNANIWYEPACVDLSQQPVDAHERFSSLTVDRVRVMESSQSLADLDTGRVGSQPPHASRDSADDRRNDQRKVAKKSKPALNPKKVKLERIATLTEEAGELRAVMSHIEDQINTLVEQHQELAEKRKAMELKQREATAAGREVFVTHLAAEISVVRARQQELSTRVKDLQRETYFVGLERKRKVGVAHQLREEIEATRQREGLKKLIEKKIRKEGLLAALQTFGGSVSPAEVASLTSPSPLKKKCSARKKRDQKCESFQLEADGSVSQSREWSKGNEESYRANSATALQEEDTPFAGETDGAEEEGEEEEEQDDHNGGNQDAEDHLFASHGHLLGPFGASIPNAAVVDNHSFTDDSLSLSSPQRPVAADAASSATGQWNDMYVSDSDTEDELFLLAGGVAGRAAGHQRVNEVGGSLAAVSSMSTIREDRSHILGAEDEEAKPDACDTDLSSSDRWGGTGGSDAREPAHPPVGAALSVARSRKPTASEA